MVIYNNQFNTNLNNMTDDNQQKKTSNRKYIFGPVPSRRLGRSLGVDLVPFKTCSYDCIYCQLGRTTNLTIEKENWCRVDDVLRQLKDKLSLVPDYITLSGSGEPTLHENCAELISRIKEITDTPVAVLTNGSLLWQSEVRQSLLEADLVIPSLDAGSKEVFQLVNRPHPDISFDMMMDGLVQFKNEYRGRYWLEVFLLDGINAHEEEIQDLKKCIHFIKPDKIQVNTVSRPPVEDYAKSIPKDRLEHLASQLHINSEVIADYKNVHNQNEFISQRDDVMSLLERRPCSIEDISNGLALHHNEVVKYVNELLKNNIIMKIVRNQKVYYKSINKRINHN